MDRRWKRRAAALLAALALTIPARAARIEADGQTLSAKDAWVEEGKSYVTLRAFAALTGGTLTWTGEKARLAGAGLELEAAPGALYVTANGRALYVPGGVRVENGVTILPLSVLANAAGAELTDDCSAVERIGFPVCLTQGSEDNLKITTPRDLTWGEAILAERMR